MFWIAEAVFMERARRAKSVTRELGAYMFVVERGMVESQGLCVLEKLSFGRDGLVEGTVITSEW